MLEAIGSKSTLQERLSDLAAACDDAPKESKRRGEKRTSRYFLLWGTSSSRSLSVRWWCWNSAVLMPVPSPPQFDRGFRSVSLPRGGHKCVRLFPPPLLLLLFPLPVVLVKSKNVKIFQLCDAQVPKRRSFARRASTMTTAFPWYGRMRIAPGPTECFVRRREGARERERKPSWSLRKVKLVYGAEWEMKGIGEMGQ